jgi:DNA-directed RNA polymerase specialized sigma24 family protein
MVRNWFGGRGGEERELEQRFGAYFPRAFAYTYSNLGNEAVACDLVAEAFGAVFTKHRHATDDQFRIELFQALRSLCHGRKRAIPLDIGISAAERDVVTLVFDAGLSSDEAREVLADEAVAVRLMVALEKMRATSSQAIVPLFFRLS